MLRVGIKGIHALLWEMVFRQERHQLPLRHLFGYQPCGQQGDAASRQSKAHQRRSAISRKPRRAGYREIHLCLVIRAQLPAQRPRQALVNNPLSLRHCTGWLASQAGEATGRIAKLAIRVAR